MKTQLPLTGEAGRRDSKTAQDIQIKFEFYIEALTFTLLGLAVQTASFGSVRGADILEVAGWAALLVAGLAGLRRIERFAHIYYVRAKRAEQEEYIETMQFAQASGAEVVSIETGRYLSPVEEIEYANRFLEKIHSILPSHEERAALLYRVRLHGFIGGLVLVIVARAINGFANW